MKTIVCTSCRGNGEYHVVGGMDVYNYNPYEEWRQCEDCNATGTTQITYFEWVKIKYWQLRGKLKKKQIISDDDLPF